MENIIQNAVAQAEAWQRQANELLTAEEKAIQEQMQSLLNNPLDKIVLTKMIDQSFRSHDPSRVADQVDYLLGKYSVPDFFSRTERLLIQMFLEVSRYIPALTVPKFVSRMRQSSSRAIISGEPEALRKHLRKRHSQNVRMNINHLGEALLGEEEALHRLRAYIEDLKNPDIEYISVKISTIYSQISSLALDHTLSILKDRLGQLYRVAGDHEFTRPDGTKVQKLVNLDMEEYRDLEITYKAFVQTLSQEEFKTYSGGIVLQAYLPDSYGIQQELTRWARRRVEKGGAPVMLRIVKGANLEMETVEAYLNNWPPAPYDTKLDVDANYKRMVLYGMDPENIQAVNLGVASHNLFELAFAGETAKARNVTPYFYFEMLEGMADHVRRAIGKMTGDVLLYAPVATKKEFINAIAYLIRRLDENTSPENFLRYAPNLKVGSGQWRYLKEQFARSCRHIDTVSSASKRVQDRTGETFQEPLGTYHTGEFTNEPDTDWSLPGNRRWAEAIRDKWKKTPQDDPIAVPLVVGGEEVFEQRDVISMFDPSGPNDQVLVARCAMGTTADAKKAVETAAADPGGWRKMSYKTRHETLSRVAMEIRSSRGDLIGAAAATTGKIYTEADVEVSEAIDFTEFYPFAARVFDHMENLTCRGKGVGLVISPWNFPIAIPCGGIVASLAAGNTVIFKPATAAAFVGYLLCRCFWRAGVPKTALQFLPCPGSEVGASLAVDPGVDYVILTGGTDTGLSLLKGKPEMNLAAETGGKNATIVTAMADRDLAIKNVLYSAFGNSGQKCSATSLLILEKEVYEDKDFCRQLADAAASLSVGSPWEFHSRIGPLIRPPAGVLQTALTTLEDGETWALKPENRDGNPCLWSPGIKWGAAPGSVTHMTEFFGPILGVMCVEDLDEALTIVNGTGYGLTSGIESLDEREQEKWKDSVRAGNLYINRGTTGAIVLRQPFGGMGKSALGAGIKAGFFNYVTQFMDIEEKGHPPVGPIRRETKLLRLANEWRLKARWGAFGKLDDEILKTARAIRSYLYHEEQEFSQEKDYFRLRGQDNIVRYLPVGKVLVRVHPDDTLFEVLARIAAVRISGCELFVSAPEDLNNPVMDFLRSRDSRALCNDAEVIREDDSAIVGKIAEMDRIRYAAPERVPAAVFAEAARTGTYIARTPVLMEGRLELLQYHREQSICHSYHRYGNLGERAELAE